ncbi:retrovirus-related pol polyprotein from transposon TNT 1-94 [Tanacetum coccineum]
MSTDKESSAAGTDNRPPMLVESDYDSWKIRIHRYIRGKPLGKLIWNSIQNGPSPHPMVTDAPTEGQTGVNMPRMKLDSEFTPEETNRENADTQAEIILSQGLPRHIFNILNQTNTAKEIWDNVEMLMQGSGRTLQQRKEDLFDEFERFRAIGNEPIRDYFVRFHKVVIDMKITQLENSIIAKHQGGQHQPHLFQQSHILKPHPAVLYPNDALMATMEILIEKSFKWFPEAVSSYHNQLRRAPGNVGNTGSRGNQSYGNVTTATGKKVICYNCRGEGHVARQCKEPKRAKDSQYFKDKMLLMEAKEKGVTLDAEAEAFLANVECTAPYDQPLAMATTNIFEVNHEDAYDSDVDEGPNAAAAFMANLSSTSGNNHHVNEVHPNAIQINDSVNYQLSHEMHHEEQSDSDVESELDDNTTPYHQLELERRAKVVPTEVSTGSSANISMVTILDEMRDTLDEKTQENQDLSLENQNLTAELAKLTQRNERNAELEQEKVMLKTHLKSKDVLIEFLKSENQKVLTDKKKLEDKYLDEIVCLSLKRRYAELSKANTHSRTAYTEKLSALTAEHTKLQAQVTGKTSSGPSTSETPKVLAPGMYNLGSKYIPPPKRANWVKSTQLPKTKQVTFIEPPRPSLKPTQKPVVHHNKQTNVCVPLSTGVKPTSGANKPVPKRAPRNHSSLPAKSTNARRVEAHHRILNKKNRVDSHLLVKHSVFVSNSNNVCGACNKSLVSATHNACLVLCDDSVNVKPHQTKRITHQATMEAH